MSRFLANGMAEGQKVEDSLTGKMTRIRMIVTWQGLMIMDELVA